MNTPQPADVVYAAIARLISLLRESGALQLADVLNHRLHVVSWSCSSELLCELQEVLETALGNQNANLPSNVKMEVEHAVTLIRSFRQNREAQWGHI